MLIEEREWVTRCSARLHAQWPRLARDVRDETARELWLQQRWREKDPEAATAEWLALGIPQRTAGLQRAA